MVVHEVGAEFGIQRFEVVAHGHAKLAAVAGITVRPTAHQHAFAVHVHPQGTQGRQGGGRNGRTLVQYPQVIAATIGDHVRLREERAAVIGHGLVPLQLVKRLGRQVVGERLGHVEHVHRDQAFLDLGPRATKRRHVNRVDGVDAATDEGTFAPAHHLLTKTHGARRVGNRVVVVDECIENLPARRLRAFLAVVVADVLERTAFVLEFEVVPVLAPHKHTGVAVLQFQVVDALEDLRERLAALEVQVPVIGGLGQALAAVVGTDQVTIGFGRGPARPHGKRRVKAPFDFTNVETDAECRPGERRSEADGQGQSCPAPELVY